MQELSVLNKQIDFNCTENYRLSIQISLNGFSFSIKDVANSEYLVLKHYYYSDNSKPNLISDLQLVYAKNPILSKKFKFANVIVESEKKTIVPEEFFSEENKDYLFALTHSLSNEETLCIDSFMKKDVILFAIKKDLSDFIRSNFKDANIIPSIKPIIHYSINRESSNYSVVLNKEHSNYCDIIISEDNKLILSNTYKFIKDIDIAFYLFNSLKSMEIDNKICNITISGDFNKKSECIDILSKCFNNLEQISILNPSKELRNNNIDIHFANLINSELCV